ncbi:MAG TPA: hypothetical protein VFH63_05465 [candidate division Zixibacteria bacterium]|nr:hypothetical protein [candidate division Zixibacteria bacterium]
MGETLDQTRLEIAAHRAEMERQAADLEARVRHALDLKARFRENPALFVGLGAGAAFLVAGGPVRVARLIRRRMRPTTAEQAYDALPKGLQRWVDTVAGELGPKTDKARLAITEELLRWRNDPLKNKKARKELARAMVEGPPGPSRTAWKAAEAALTLLSAALARRAIEAFLTGERPIRPSAPASLLPSSTDLRKGAPKEPKDAVREANAEYTGFSSRSR